MTPSIDVSIIVAAYEASDFVGAAIASCLQQNDVSFEVIVVDDGSKVSCRPIVEAIAQDDKRVRFIQLPQNSGPSGARNAGIQAANGTYIAVLDADDAMLPNRLKTLHAAARAQSADIVVDNMMATPDIANEALFKPFLTLQDTDTPTEITLETYLDPRSDHRFGRSLGYLKPLISRQFLDQHSIAYDTSLTNSEDFYIIAEMLAHGARMVLLPDAFYVYRVHEGSTSHRLNPKQTSAILAAERAFQKRHADRLGTAGHEIAKRRLDGLTHTHEYETLRDDLLQRAPIRFLGHLARNPLSAPAHIWSIMKVLMKRF